MKLKHLVILPMIALSLVGCKKQIVKSAVTQQERAEVHCSGPKMRVAVLPVGATGKLGAFEGFDIGEAMAAHAVVLLEDKE